MQVRRKYQAKKPEGISEFNKRKDYSKMLRQNEEDERFENEMKEMRENRGSKNLTNEALYKKYQAQKSVKFEFEMGLNEEV